MKFIAVTNADLNNGIGCRVTLWIAGCQHKCNGCQNRFTWDYNMGFNWDEIKPVVYEYLSKPYIKGITFSGGDPLDQSSDDLNELKSIINTIRDDMPEKDIWLYTGFYFDELTPIQKDIVGLCDVLVDGPFIKEKKDLSLPFRGSSNQSIIYVKQNK